MTPMPKSRHSRRRVKLKMVDFSDIAYEGQNGPVDDEEFWETVYPLEDTPESLTDDSVHEKENNEDVSVKAADMEVWSWIPEVLDDGHVNGEGTGTEITGVVAAVLDTKQRYGFEFAFYKVDEPTPWDGEKQE